MSLCALTAEVLEQPHTAREYLPWVKGLAAAVRAESDGLRQIRLRVGLAKNLMEEALPIGLFASRFFCESDEVEIALKVGSQGYDAIVKDTRSNSSGIEHLEVTVASEGETDYLRMLRLHETGFAPGFGSIAKSGTKKTGFTVIVEQETVSQSEVLAIERRALLAAIDRKACKLYPENTVLVIAIDDTMSHDRPDNQAGIASVLCEKRMDLKNFHTVAVVGLVAGLFICQSRDAT